MIRESGESKTEFEMFTFFTVNVLEPAVELNSTNPPKAIVFVLMLSNTTD
jgi:hypothetical protein